MRPLRLLTDHIFGSFAKLVYSNRERVYRLWLVSPWIGVKTGTANDPLYLLLEAARFRPCHIVVVTRPPVHVWHSRAIDLFTASELTTIYLSPQLHTKLYIAECDGFRAAILGSPNLTPAAEERNSEIAIEFRTTREDPSDDIAAMLTDLTRYASSLRGESDTILL